MSEKYLQGKKKVFKRYNLWFTVVKINLIENFWYFVVKISYKITSFLQLLYFLIIAIKKKSFFSPLSEHICGLCNLLLVTTL